MHLVKRNALYNRMFSIRRGTYFWQKHALTNIVEILLQTIFFFSKDLKRRMPKRSWLSLSILVCSTVIYCFVCKRQDFKATAIVVDISTSAIFLASTQRSGAYIVQASRQSSHTCSLCIQLFPYAGGYVL